VGIRDNFKKGTVELMILALLIEGDMYGYQLSQEIKHRSGGEIHVPEGAMYPTLYRLQEGGYISDYRILAGKRMTRVMYHLEDPGRDRLKLLWTEYQIFYQGLVRVVGPGIGQLEGDAP